MDTVRYSILMKQYLDKVMPLAETLQREDRAKSRVQLERETALMIEYMEIIQLINRYDTGEGFGTMLRRKITSLCRGLWNRLGWRTPHLA